VSSQEITPTNQTQGVSAPVNKQYALWQIVGIWLSAGAPMWLLGLLVYPAMSVGLSLVDAGLLRIKLLTVGLIWQFTLAMIILYFEEGNIRLSTISRRFWLNHPVSARTGETKKSLWWWIVPLIALVTFVEIGFRPTLVNLWTMIYPLFAKPTGYNMAELFSLKLSAQPVEIWGLLGLFLVNQLFNTVLGEEFLFRGVLLPKMEGVFGKWDWVANGILFSLYHLHQPWEILATLPADLVFVYSGKRFRCNWFPILLHSGQGVFFLFLFLILGLVLGLA